MNCQVTPIQNRINFLNSTCSLSVGRLSAIVEGSILFPYKVFCGDWHRTLHVNEWPEWFFRYLAGSESFWISSCPFHRIFNLCLASPSYDYLRVLCGFGNHGWWMWVFTFELKQLLDFFRNPRYAYIIKSISKIVKILNKTFWELNNHILYSK